MVHSPNYTSIQAATGGDLIMPFQGSSIANILSIYVKDSADS
ncbi:MAG: hypothetical protein VST66_03365 [Nitrospirota bacterium]|nr:hypothetical protein [Nitrospirota bacterium]